MKRTLIAAAGLALFTACGAASAASWSVVVEPGVYGRVEIGGYAQAPTVYEAAPVVVDNDGDVIDVDSYDQAVQYQEPVYLWVPEYQRLHWNQYCDQYGARGVPVYFVQDGWYRDNVMGRRWTPAQRSWSRDQWIEQDRVARDRWEHARWDRAHWNRQPDDRPPAQWQGARGAPWAPQTSWQSRWHGDPQRGAQQPQRQPQRQPQQQQPWHDDPGHAMRSWNGTPVRNEPDRNRGDGSGRGDGNPDRFGNPPPVGGWTSGSSLHGQPVISPSRPSQSGQGVYRPAQPSPGTPQPGEWARGGARPAQPGFGANQPAPGVGSQWSQAPVRPVQTAYNPGQNAARSAPHDGGERTVSQERDDGRAQGNERGQYQPHAGGYQNR